jgi:hypothetical protein
MKVPINQTTHTFNQSIPHLINVKSRYILTGSKVKLVHTFNQLDFESINQLSHTSNVLVQSTNESSN